MKKLSFLSISLFILGFVTCISCGYLISTALVSSNLFQFASVVSFEKQTVFAISMAKSQNKQEVEIQKEDLQSKNGAGYVYQKDKYFYLLASTYSNLNDAELVKSNLKNNNIDSEILEIELSAWKIEGSFSNDEKTILANSLKSDFEIFKNLYDVAISLDTNVYDKTKAKLECNNIFSNHVSIKANYETFFKKQNTNQNLKLLEETLSKTNTTLSNLISENFETTNQTFSSLIKLSYCQILFE